jgi:hypothetical protein
MSRLAKIFIVCLVLGLLLFSYVLDVFAAREIAPGRVVTWVKIRVYEEGSRQPDLTVGLPVGLVEWALNSTRSVRVMGLDGVEMNTRGFWQRLRKSNPKEPVELESDDGHVQVWLE